MEPNPVPGTLFEAFTGVPAPRGDAVAEPMNMEVDGTVCDFCPTDLFAEAPPDPVVWAFPAGEATRSAELGTGGFTLSLPIASGALVRV
ncbi:hypothetical protein [Streptomyces sp. ISL-100]|uniref:hypothetical protein n=1 Tax=Streptomyces sp. ISL-100 TaxID=2819173 RepID=UPI001BE772B2|nr:hypothetical protein [Streptomyces sp. ISL-100]MBT2401669.1 hypothetical protein [Streptomyces sp. ISL-100]